MSEIETIMSTPESVVDLKTARLQAEAAYQRALVTAALNYALAHKDEVCFDPQGRVLVEVALTTKQKADLLFNHKALYKQLTGLPYLYSEDDRHLDEALEKLLGKRASAKTLCSLDVMDFVSESGETHPYEALKEVYFTKFSSEDATHIVNELLNERSSILPLYEELSAHSHLMNRAIEKKLKSMGFAKEIEAKAEKIKASLDKQIEQWVCEAFKQAVSEVKTECEGDSSRDKVALLNKKLASQRATLKQEIHITLLHELKEAFCLEKKDDSPEVQNLYRALASLNEADFTHITATSLDYVHTDGVAHAVTRITGCGNNTAHNKRAEPNSLALRVIKRSSYIPTTGKVSHFSDATTNARVPSIAKGGKVKEKLAHIYEQLTASRGKADGPITYHLLTSLNSYFFDSNSQTKHAEQIFAGMHAYNAEQMTEDGLDESKCIFVQNIAVNRYSQNLGYGDFWSGQWFQTAATQEATLMADFSMLALFSHNEEADLTKDGVSLRFSQTYGQVLAQYQAYLNEKPRPPYFYRSSQGIEARSIIHRFKVEFDNISQMARLKSIGADAPLKQKIVKALAILYTQNLHYKKEYGALIQALTMYVNDISVSGCKSANERNEDMYRRVEYLQRLNVLNGEDKTEQDKIFEAKLTHFIASSGGDAELENLRCALAKATNQCGAYSSVAAISREDQGGPSKLRHFSETSVYNTNYAMADELTRATGKEASSLQAHKGMLGFVNLVIKKLNWGNWWANSFGFKAKSNAESGSAVVGVEKTDHILSSEAKVDRLLGVTPGQARKLDVLSVDRPHLTPTSTTYSAPINYKTTKSAAEPAEGEDDDGESPPTRPRSNTH